MTTTAFVDGSTLSAASWANDVDTLTYNRLTSPAGTNTITGTGPASMTAYATGQLFSFIPANTNTGATTLNITPSGSSALGAKNVYANNAACIGGEIRANVPVFVFYDGTQFQILASGADTKFSALPAFSASAPPVANVTGDGTTYTIIFSTEIFDKGGNFDGTSTFTAPITGRYLLSANILMEQVGVAHTVVLVNIVTSNRTYTIFQANGSIADANGSIVISGTVLADMEAADTATVTVRAINGTKVVDISTSYFQGSFAGQT